MNSYNMRLTPARFGFALALASVLMFAGCAKKDDQASFKTPDEAVNAFVAAMQADDVPALTKLLGPGSEDLLSSGDAVQDKTDRQKFLAGYQKKHSLQDDGKGSMTLVVGDNDWPLPIPVVKRDDKWYLDGAAGADELIYRRVGSNELGAIAVCRGLVDAQAEYASQGRDGDPAGIYALKFFSDEGLHNGLYWPTAEGEPESPLGPLAAGAANEGYRSAEGGGRNPYHGYYYRMIYAQGSNAAGGAKEYFDNGVMTGGFALVAWPADYGSSGVQTFIVNQDGVVYQKDLGEDTANVVETIKTFDPDSSWTAVPAPESPAAG